MKQGFFHRLPLAFWLALLLPAAAIAAGAHMIHLAGRDGFTEIPSAEQQ